jgi:hypothetical protein
VAWGTATGLKEKKSFKCGIIYNVQRCRHLNGVSRKRSPVGSGDRMEFKVPFAQISKFSTYIYRRECVIFIEMQNSRS